MRLILTRVTEADPPGAVRALGTLLLAAGLRVRGVRVAVPRQGEVQLVPGECGQDGHGFSVPCVPGEHLQDDCLIVSAQKPRGCS